MNADSANFKYSAQTSTAMSLLMLVLRPAIKFLLRHSFKIQDIRGAIKILLLDIAREEMNSRGIEPTLSRLSVMTGIPRKFIETISTEKFEISGSGNVVTKIIGQWQSDRRFLNALKRPRKLSISGADSQFAQLVRSANVDLNPYTILFELERVGVVRRIDDTIQLVRRSFLRNSVSDALEIASEDAADLFSAAEENGASGTETPHLHLSTFYDNIPDDAVDTIRNWFLREGSLFHKRARAFISKYDKDISPKKQQRPGRNRVRLGAFSFIEKLEK